MMVCIRQKFNPIVSLAKRHCGNRHPPKQHTVPALVSHGQKLPSPRHFVRNGRCDVRKSPSFKCCPDNASMATEVLLFQSIVTFVTGSGSMTLRPRLSAIMTGIFLAMGTIASPAVFAADPWVVYDGHDGPGKGKHIVLVSGDDEYRSEEALPQLGKILAMRHGFKCTVLFPIDPADGTIKPDYQTNIPGLEVLPTADLVVMFLRFRDLPDGQMKYLVDYIESGRPVVAMRTATHSFNIKSSLTYAKYTWTSKDWDGGFGRQVLGETWVSHHGKHGSQSTRGLIAKEMNDHPILRGIKDGDIWGPTDVYGVNLPLPGDSQPLVMGQVLAGMKPDSEPVEGEQNDPMMPVAWIKSYTGTSGKPARIFTTTMGASQDLQSEGLRRLLVNACFWGLGMESRISNKMNVDLVGEYHPTPFKFGGYTKGVKPADHVLK
jgi:hypothetical protein